MVEVLYKVRKCCISMMCHARFKVLYRSSVVLCFVVAFTCCSSLLIDRKAIGGRPDLDLLFQRGLFLSFHIFWTIEQHKSKRSNTDGTYCTKYSKAIQ